MKGNKDQMSEDSKMSCKPAEENRNTHQLLSSMHNKSFCFRKIWNFT